MKIRLGHVSNSSTSSFVIAGVKVKDKKAFNDRKKLGIECEDEEDFFEKLQESKDFDSIYLDNDDIILGKLIADIDVRYDPEIEETEIDLTELVNDPKIKFVEKVYAKVKFITGTRYG